jgi:hypothetical protein
MSRIVNLIIEYVVKNGMLEKAKKFVLVMRGIP